MKIGVIGTGVVGTTLAKGFLSEGYEVMIGTRDVTKPEIISFITENSAIALGTFAECAKFGEIIVLATGGGVTIDAIKLAGESNFSGKVILDATNPIGGPPADGLLPLYVTTKSLIEMIQEVVPDALVVKCFSSTGSPTFYKPTFKDGLRGSMFICGNNPDAKKVATEILDKFGWDTEDMGPATAGLAVEYLSVIWCQPGFVKNDWFHAFKMIR